MDKEQFYLVAFSGGRDSVAVAHKLVSTGHKVSLMHVNHGLQEVALEWEQFAQKFATQLGVEVYIERVNVVTKGGQSEEAVAREARYAALCSKAKNLNAILVTGHHQDDQEETMLLQLTRGTGLKGLRGIQALAEINSVNVLRPNLGLSRSEITAYCEQNNLRWVEDPTNSDTSVYSRNFIRLVCDAMRVRIPTFSSGMQRMRDVAQDSLELLEELAELDLSSCIEGQEPCSLKVVPLLSKSDARIRNALRFWLSKSFPFVQVEQRHLLEIIKSLNTVTPKKFTCGKLKIEYKRNILKVST